MLAVTIIVAEVLHQLARVLWHVFVFGHCQLRLDRSKARFHEGVAVAVGGPAHALADGRSTQYRPETLAHILPAPIDAGFGGCLHNRGRSFDVSWL